MRKLLYNITKSIPLRYGIFERCVMKAKLAAWVTWPARAIRAYMLGIAILYIEHEAVRVGQTAGRIASRFWGEFGSNMSWAYVRKLPRHEYAAIPDPRRDKYNDYRPTYLLFVVPRDKTRQLQAIKCDFDTYVYVVYLLHMLGPLMRSIAARLDDGQTKPVFATFILNLEKVAEELGQRLGVVGFDVKVLRRTIVQQYAA